MTAFNFSTMGSGSNSMGTIFSSVNLRSRLLVPPAFSHPRNYLIWYGCLVASVHAIMGATDRRQDVASLTWSAIGSIDSRTLRGSAL
jgi:hypothetical protein